MGFVSEQIKKFLNINEDIKREVRSSMNLAKIELIETYPGALLDYSQALNYVWFQGLPQVIEEFYKTKSEPGNYTQHYFWKDVNGEIVKLHYPLASSISRAMSSILFGEDVHMKVDTGNIRVSETLTNRLEKIMEDNNIKELLQRGAIMESYSGSLGAKIVVDSDFSQYPQIQFYAAEQIELETKYGKIVEIIFKDDYIYNGNKYKLKSKYGKGYIKYGLYDKDNKEVMLSSIPSLATLKNIAILGTDGEPLDIMLAVFKPNRVVSSNFNQSHYGASDYEGLYPVFNALDELLSVWNDHYRNGRITTFMSEDMLKRNPNTGEVVKPNAFGLNTVVLYDSTANMDKKSDVKRDIPKLDVMPFKEGFENYIKVSLQRVGLSPITFGFDSVSRLSSAETLQEREKTTLRTRQDKVKLWDEFLTKLLRLIFIFDELGALTPSESGEEIVYQLTNDWDNTYLVEWAQYDSPSKEEQVRVLGEALKSNLITIEKAYHILYDEEYPEEEVLAMIAEAKSEQTNRRPGQRQQLPNVANSPVPPVVEEENEDNE